MMARTTSDEEQLRKGLERDTIPVEDSVVRIENKIYHKELVRKLPLAVIFGRLSEDEKRLSQLIYLDGMSVSEIAQILDKDYEKVAREVNHLRNKIRKRVKSALQKNEAENKLLLAWEQIYSKRDRLAS